MWFVVKELSGEHDMCGIPGGILQDGGELMMTEQGESRHRKKPILPQSSKARMHMIPYTE